SVRIPRRRIHDADHVGVSGRARALIHDTLAVVSCSFHPPLLGTGRQAARLLSLLVLAGALAGLVAGLLRVRRGLVRPPFDGRGLGQVLALADVLEGGRAAAGGLVFASGSAFVGGRRASGIFRFGCHRRLTRAAWSGWSGC